MNLKKRSGIKKAVMALGLMVLMGFSFIGMVSCSQSNTAAKTSGNAAPSQQTGQIYLYGEQHGVEKILEKELALWNDDYHEKGMRHLFIEMPYYTAEFLNLWMQADNDDLLNEIYEDWAGTLSHNQSIKEFYQNIKNQCPETVFHGTDVGHQYDSTGERYLNCLRDNQQEDSEKYQTALEAIEQGKYYYEHSDPVYRENKLVENFIREFDKLEDQNVMGIYGSAHTGLEAMDYETHTIPCMANQLYNRYGDALHAEDLSLLSRDVEPLRADVLTVGGKEYEASYFGQEDLTQFQLEFDSREFWRLEDAYDDFKEMDKTGDVLPYDNYPMLIEEGQVFVIIYRKADGSEKKGYYRSDGNAWEGRPATEEFVIE